MLNWRAEHIAEAHAIATAQHLTGPCAAQLPYSLLRRRPVESPAMRQVCGEASVGVVASASLAGGLLSGRYNDGRGEPGSRLGAAQLDRVTGDAQLARLRALGAEAERLGATQAQIALAYCLANDRVASLLFGATSVRQVHDNVGALELAGRLDGATVSRLRELFPDPRTAADAFPS